MAKTVAKKSKPKLVHLLVDECSVCGTQEFGCEVENPRNYSYWTDEVTCRKCVPNIRPLIGKKKKVKHGLDRR